MSKENLLFLLKELERRNKLNLVYASERCALVLGDSAEVLPLIPNGMFDTVITDPPYGLNYIHYDNSNEIFFRLEEELYRILKKDAWFVFWWSTKKIPEITRLKRFEYFWMLLAYFMRTTSRCAFGWRTYTPVFVFKKGNPKVLAKRQDVFPSVELPQFLAHPIKQGDFKPTYVQACLLETFARGRLVLDPFSGFGSLLVANEETEIADFVFGIEKDRNRVEKAISVIKERDFRVLGKQENPFAGTLPLFCNP